MSLKDETKVRSDYKIARLHCCGNCKSFRHEHYMCDEVGFCVLHQITTTFDRVCSVRPVGFVEDGE